MQAKIARVLLLIGICQVAQQFVFGQKINRRIKNGDVVSLKDYPYVVNIWRGQSYICGGSLITSKCILTAAHCVEGGDSSGLSVYGALQSGQQQQAFQSNVDEILLPHDRSIPTTTTPTTTEGSVRRSYDEHNLDVALLVLNDHFAANEVTTIDIDTTRVEPGDEVSITGWGSTHYWSTPSAELNVYNSTVTHEFLCKFFWGEVNSNADTFCVDARKGHGPCRHDSGGPAIRNGKQVGVLSNIHECGRLPAPSLHTRLSSRPVQAFLRSNMDRYC